MTDMAIVNGISEVIVKEPMDGSTYGTYRTYEEAKNHWIISEQNDTFVKEGDTLIIYLID